MSNQQQQQQFQYPFSNSNNIIDKNSIYMYVNFKFNYFCSIFEIRFKIFLRHPLFPLLKLLHEKCELVTNDPELLNQQDISSQIQNYLNENFTSFNTFNTNNNLLDELVIRTEL